MKMNRIGAAPVTGAPRALCNQGASMVPPDPNVAARRKSRLSNMA
jgi:hypothetical protein